MALRCEVHLVDTSDASSGSAYQPHAVGDAKSGVILSPSQVMAQGMEGRGKKKGHLPRRA